MPPCRHPSKNVSEDALANLGLSADATVEDVQRAYKKLALEHHPDRGGDKEAFQRIKASADILCAGFSPVERRLAESFGGIAVSHAKKCRDNIRGLLLLTGSLADGAGPVLMTLDEKQVLMSTECLEWVPLRAADEAFLCCCELQNGEKDVAVGTSRGHVHLVSSQQCDTSQPPDPIAAGHGPVLALECASEWPPLLLASVAGRVTLIDYAVGCALRSLDESLPSLLDTLVDGVMAEALCHVSLCPAPARRASASGALQLGDESLSCTRGNAAACVCIAGSDERGGGGLLLSLRIDLVDQEHDPGSSALLEEDADDEDGAAADALQLHWRVAHDSPVYAAAAAPCFIVAATGDACMLHQLETGTVLRRLAAGSGVLYALAISPAGDCLLAGGSEEVVHSFNFPSGTKRAELHVPRTTARDCSLNSATINALAFIDNCTFISGGYDAATTRWKLALPPRPPAVADCSGKSGAHDS